MNYNNYKKSRNLAWRILLDFEIRELPVTVVPICRSIGVNVKLVDTHEFSGKVQVIQNKPIILVSSNEPKERQRFTAAHELGHILLDHVGHYQLINRDPSPSDNPIERDANIFASRLLAPACVLWGCGVRSAEDIAKLCHISMPAARFRWERMQILYKRNMFLSHPLERKVYEQFLPYIEQYKL